MKRLAEYAKSLPIRIALAAAVFGLAMLAREYRAREPAPAKSAEGPAPLRSGQTGGIDALHQEGTDMVIRDRIQRGSTGTGPASGAVSQPPR